ncbi:hypothetical protein Tco_1393763 [Tanacetum coccineum]
MVENQLTTAIEVQKHIENENESDPEVSDPKDVVEKITGKITRDSDVVEKITDAEEIVCKDPSRAQGKCGVKGR